MRKNRNTKNTTPLSKSKELILVGAVLILTFILFSPSLKNNFVNWDDELYVTENKTITSISFNDLGKFGDNIAGNFHPLTMLSLAIDYHFFGLNPFFYHLKNIIFHLFNTLLVFYFIKRISKNNLFVSLLTALIFGIHPMHVESVTWVAERKDVLYTFYFLIGLLLYYQYLIKGKIVFLIAAAFSFILSTLSKSAAVVFPVVLFLIDYFEARKVTLKTILEKVPLFLISLYIGITAFKTQSDSIIGLNTFSIIERLKFASYGFIDYLVRFIYPHNLSAFHPFPEKGNIPIAYNLALIGILLLIGYMVFVGRKNKWLVFGAGFYLVTVALVLQFISVGKAVVAERYTYVPYIGVGFMYFTFMYKFFSENKNINLKYLVGTLLIFQLFFFSAKTYSRTKIWHDPETLWSDVINKYPDEALAYTNRGHFYLSLNNMDKAMEDYSSAIKLDNKSDNAYYNRGKIYFERGEYDLALADYNKCLALLPDFAEALNNRGVVYIFKKDFDKAFADLNRSLELEPENKKALADRGFLYFQLDQYENSIKDNDNCLRLDPENQGVINTNGLCYYNLKKFDLAIAEFNRCIALNPANCSFFANRALAYYATGDKDKALEDATKAQQLGCSLDPTFFAQLNPN